MPLDPKNVGLMVSLVTPRNYSIYSRYQHITPEFIASFIPEFIDLRVAYFDWHNDGALSRKQDQVWSEVDGKRALYLHYDIVPEDAEWSKKHHLIPPFKQSSVKEWVFYKPREVEEESHWTDRIRDMSSAVADIVERYATYERVRNEGCRIFAYCARCNERRDVTDIDFPTRISGDISFDIISDKMSCKECGKKKAYVTIGR